MVGKCVKRWDTCVKKVIKMCDKWWRNEWTIVRKNVRNGRRMGKNVVKNW
jgi:hypothetical protein